MSRSGYSDDCDNNWDHIRWRGAVTSAIKGKRGQAFLKEMLQALEALPEKKLVEGLLDHNGSVCALGAVFKQRQIDVTNIDPDDSSTVASKLGIAESMAREIVYWNDEWCWNETNEERYARMVRWVRGEIK